MFFMAAEGFAEQDADTSSPHHSVSHSVATNQENVPLKIFFYNPEINASRNLTLKNTWDSFLNEQGNFTFQPVDRGEDFKALLENEKRAAFIMSEWLFNHLKLEQDEHFSISLQGIKDGQETYRRILVSRTSDLDLEKSRIASSGDQRRSLSILADIFPSLSPAQAQQLKLLQVPKDIDALMALGYGLADMALTSEVSLTIMANLNQSRFQELSIIKHSKPLRQSILVFKQLDKNVQEALVRGMMNMPDSDTGRQAISMIGLDNWKILDAELSTLMSRASNETNTLVADETNEHVMDSSDNKGGRK